MLKFFKKWLIVLLCGAMLLFAAGLLRDSGTLERDLIRLHITANSDSREDQTLKLQVRDAIQEVLTPVMREQDDAQSAARILRDMLPQVQAAADKALQAAGSAQRAVVRLCREEFPARAYEDFSLPAGIYETLRVTLGEGKGHNWWCVVFPGLCLPASAETIETEAERVGMSDDLTRTVRQTDGYYAVRFKLLDLLGRLKCALASG